MKKLIFTTLFFVMTFICNSQNNASIGNYVWEDLDGDGIQEGEELGISGIIIVLTGSTTTGQAIRLTDTSNIDGKYLFENLESGQYLISVIETANFDLTTPGQGGNQAIDSDFNLATRTSQLINLSESQILSDIDLGLIKYASIGDYVWIDENNNGIQDINEHGYSGANIKLNGLTGSGTIVELSTISDFNGKYSFNNLHPGSYTLEIVNNSQFEITEQHNVGDDAKDNDFDQFSFNTFTELLMSGENNQTYDAGIILNSNLGCSDTVRFIPQYSFDGEDLILEIYQFDEDSLIAFQWGLNWDPNIYQFKTASSSLQNFDLIFDIGHFNNKLLIAYTQDLNNSSLDISLPLLTFRFKILDSSGLGEFNSDPVIATEFITPDLNVSCITFDPFSSSLNLGSVSGTGQLDLTDDCAADGQALKDWKLKFDNGNKTYVRSIKADGTYSASFPEGNYTVTLLPKFDYYASCSTPQNITISDTPTTNVNFVGKSLIDCAVVQVDVSAPFLRRCFDNTVNIRYENVGTQIAENSQVKLILDDDLDVISSSLPYTLQGDTLNYDLGNLDIDQSGNIILVVNVDCATTVLGETHCITALGYPNFPCFIPSNYTGSDIDINAVCDEINNKVKFTIKNVGTAAMPASKEFIVTEDDVMRPPVIYNLGVNQTYLVEIDADGKTYGIITEQEDNFPGRSQPSAYVEGCGNSASPSFGIINTFPLDDADPFVDILCLQNIGSYDPNDITGYPYGYGPKKYIEKYNRLEYKVRFQNTGTDTAFTVIVRNVINPEIDITTFKMLGASHNYSYSFINERELEVKFSNIRLLDSTRDETNSHGYFIYEAMPNQELIDDDTIGNVADIYFDFNAPVRTNTELHTIGRPLFVSSTTQFSSLQLFAFPNPTYDAIIIEGITKSNNHIFSITDLNGMMVQKGKLDGPISCRNLVTGTYIISVFDDNSDQVGSIKIVKK